MKLMVKKITKKDKIQSDIEFWADKNYKDRLSAVQELREQYIVLFNKQKEYNESRERLRRIYKIVKRTRS